MLKILREYGIRESIVAATGLLSTGTKAKVLSPDSEFFEVIAGVLQGDTLVSFIFTIMLENAMKQAIWNDAQEIIGFKLNQKISRRHQHNTNIVTNLEFTANIVLVTEEMEQMQDFLDYAEHNVQKLACT